MRRGRKVEKEKIGVKFEKAGMILVRTEYTIHGFGGAAMLAMR